jgi:aspartyl/asparaginyl-tRNA synthetase
MCEFTGMDFEMEIKQHYHELLDVLGDLFIYIFDNLNKTCEAELKSINQQYKFEPLKYLRKTLVIDFRDAVKLLREAGEAIDDFDDFSTPQEKLLGRLVRAKYDTDFYIVDKYPATVRPFYTMPCPKDKNYTNSYDVFVRGEEITSGAQRVHDYELLKQRITEKGIPQEGVNDYLESFRYGAWPHGGAGIGLERVVMLFLGLDNIRKASLFPRTPVRLTP